jgi:excisionase family DNA binding protein
MKRIALNERLAATLPPCNRELSTSEAAQFLNVSRSFVIKEINEGRLKHRAAGAHRRIAFEDLVAHANALRETKLAALDRMAENERELGLAY